MVALIVTFCPSRTLLLLFVTMLGTMRSGCGGGGSGAQAFEFVSATWRSKFVTVTWSNWNPAPDTSGSVPYPTSMRIRLFAFAGSPRAWLFQLLEANGTPEFVAEVAQPA